jgi:hypothetical protein
MRNITYCIDYFLPQLLIHIIYAVGSNLLNLWEVLLLGTIFYIVCADVSDIDSQKFRRYEWDNLFRKYSVVKEYRDKNLVVSDRNILSIDIFINMRKQRNNLMLRLALNGLGSAYLIASYISFELIKLRRKFFSLK